MAVAQSALIEQGLKHIWYPCSQMKDYESFAPLVIAAANGSYLELANGQKIIDAISNWWCKSLGHRHPRLHQALLQQLERFEHVLLPNTTNEVIVKLSAKLAQLTSTLDKAFYASDGSSAMEIAMKMSLHARVNQGKSSRTKFIALKNSYHGETAGALSASDLGIYRDPYRSMLFDVHFISPMPYVLNRQEPLWSDCAAHWHEIEKQLAPFTETATALLVEPIVQGTAGMQIYSQDLLKRLRAWTKQHDIHLIADEIMTGIGRTGKMLACEHAAIEPDFLCLSKGLTAGWLPLSVVLTSTQIYDIFYDDYHTGKSFLHSHTHSGNALAASVALETLTIFSEEALCERATELETIMLRDMQEIAAETGRLKNVRGIGAIVAADLICHDSQRRLGFEVYQHAVTMGALLRPIGNTLYWMPPLNISAETLAELKEITTRAIMAV